MNAATICTTNTRFPPPPRLPEIAKVCSCGLHHTRHDWEDLETPGLWDLGDEVFDLRNCMCGSTMALPVKVAG